MMEDIQEFISVILPTIAESIMAFYLFGSLLTRRPHLQKSRLVFLVPILLNAVLIHFAVGANPIVKLLLFISILLVLMLILFKENFLILSFFAVLLEYILIMTDLFVGNFISLLASSSALNIGNSDLIVFLAKFLNLAFIWVIIRIFKPLDLNIDKKYWLYLNIITITFMVISVCYVALYPTLELTRSKKILFLILTMSFFIVSCLVIYFFILICRFFQKERNHYITQLTNSALQQQLMLQESMAESTKKFRHDFKSNLQTLSYFMETAQYDNAKKYLDELCSSFSHYPSLFNSGNSVLDAVLNCKVISAEKHGIRLNADIRDLPSLELAYTDFATILSNLLDNAIEACIPLPEEKRIVTLKILPVKNYVNIILQNKYVHTLKTEKSFFATTKSDHGSHGYGLKLVQDAVRRSSGYFTCSAENQEFTASVLLPLTQNP